MPLKAIIEVDLESTAYIFDNAFHYEWFRGARAVAAKLPGPDVFTYDHSTAAKHAALGGAVEVEALDPDAGDENTFKWYRVTSTDLERAYGLAAVHLVELLDGGADVNACDCWLQYAVFGKLVYG